MRKVLFLHLVIFAFVTPAPSQNITEDSSKSDECFLAAKRIIDPDAKALPKAKAICIGQRISVKLKNNKFITGRVSSFSQNSIKTSKGKEIDVNNIKWIKATKLTASRAVIGTLMTVAGLALYIPAARGDVNDADQAMDNVGYGSYFIIGGVAILLSRTKFRLNKGDTLIFKNLELEQAVQPTTR